MVVPGNIYFLVAVGAIIYLRVADRKVDKLNHSPSD